jgi:hypothetical protein
MRAGEVTNPLSFSPTTMNYIHIKSNARPLPGQFRKTGILVKPNLIGEVKSDEELYRRLQQEKEVVIAEFSDDNPFELNEPITITPEQFQEQWRGD